MDKEQNQKKGLPILLGNKYGDEDTKEAARLLDEAGFPYRYAHCNSLNGIMPQLLSGLTDYVGLGKIGRVARRYKQRHSLVETL